MRAKFLLIMVLVVIGVLAIISCFYTVNVTEYAVITQFGDPVHDVTEAGLRVKLPTPIQKVNRFDRRKRLFASRLMEFLTKDKKNIVVKFYVCWSIKNPRLFLQAVGTDASAEQKLDDMLTSKGGGALGDFDFNDLVSVEHTIKINELKKRIMDDISNQVKKDYGIEVHEIGMSRLALPEANAYSVYERMRAERKAIANMYRGQGQEGAAVIRAKAEREKSDILSKAYKQAQVIMGKGEGEAARIYAGAFKKDPEFYRFWRTLESYRKVLDEKTTLVLDDNSELLRYLK